MATILIGLDDTDNATSRGTGHLARLLLAECERRGLRGLGVTRHQLLLDERIPYTSHNSAACVAVAADDGTAPVAFAMDFVAERAADGSDPGVCIAAPDAVAGDVVEFGRRATGEIVTVDQAERLARRAEVDLRPLGGSGLGIIGALASVGLRSGGDEGRFIELAGLRSLGDRVGADEIARLGIQLVHRGRHPQPGEAYKTLGWVRPRLTGGRAVWPVEWDEQRDAWIPVDRKRNRPLE